MSSSTTAETGARVSPVVGVALTAAVSAASAITAGFSSTSLPVSGAAVPPSPHQYIAPDDISNTSNTAETPARPNLTPNPTLISLPPLQSLGVEWSLSS